MNNVIITADQIRNAKLIRMNANSCTLSIELARNQFTEAMMLRKELNRTLAGDDAESYRIVEVQECNNSQWIEALRWSRF